MPIKYFKEFICNNFDVGLLRGAISSAVIMLLGLGFGFLAQLVVARILGVEDFGNYIYVLAWISSLTVVGKLGFDVASIRFIATYKSSFEWASLKGFLKTSRSIVCIFSVIAGFLLMIVISPALNLVNISAGLKDTFLIAIPLLIVLSLIQTYGGALRGFGSVKQALAPQTIFYPVLLILSVVAISYSGFSVSSSTVMFVNVFSALMVLFLQAFLINKAEPEEMKHVKARFRVKEWVSISLPMGLTSGSMTLFKVMDILIVGVILGVKEAGIYAIASRAAGFASFGLQAVNMVVAPSFARMSSGGDKTGLQYVATKAAWLTFVATVPIMLLLYGYSDFILSIFGKDFSAGVVVLNILLIGELVNTLSGSNGILMNMTDMQREQAKILYQSLILLILLIYLFTCFWGIIGAAIAVALVVSIRNILILYRLWKLAQINTTIFPYHRWFS